MTAGGTGKQAGSTRPDVWHILGSALASRCERPASA
jgi:hypothetical protein